MFHQQGQILLKDNLILLETCVRNACHVSMTFLTEKKFHKGLTRQQQQQQQQTIYFVQTIVYDFL